MELARVMDIAIQKDLTGIYNCGTVDSCSKYDFAQRIADFFGLDNKLITPISIDDFNFKAKRGKKLALNTAKLEKDIDYKLPTIDQSIASFYRDFKCGFPAEIKKKQIVPAGNPGLLSYGRQYIDENDIQTVVHTLSAERITQGPKIEKFEEKLAEECSAKYAVAVNSGTSALHIACLVAGIKEGDEVITSPNTFVASANCAVYCGAKPVFADIDPRTYNVSPGAIEEKINKHTRAVIPVHFAGQSCDMNFIYNAIKNKEKQYKEKIFIIEDASQAMGSLYKGKKIGACEFSDMTTMSFHPVKHITTGEGGAVLTNDTYLYKKLKRIRNHGITNVPEEFINEEQAFEFSSDGSESVLNPWYYEQLDLGFNYRITDIQCSLGLSQLKKLEGFRRRRREIVETYNRAFGAVKNIRIPFEAKDCDSNFHLYVLLLEWEKIGVSRSGFMSRLKDRGVHTQVHFIPVHTQPFFMKKFGTDWGDCTNAEQYYRKCLSIPLYPAMDNEDVSKVINYVCSSLTELVS